MKESLKTYLIKNFLFVLLFIGVTEALLEALYRYIIPILLDYSGLNNVEITSEGSITFLILELLLLAILQLLPRSVYFLIQGWNINLFGDKWQVVLNSQNGLKPDIFAQDPLLRGLVAFVFLGFLVLIILPYCLGIFWYYKKVSVKVTELINEEIEQQKANERARNLMLSDITHDIKTPITTICGYSKILTDKTIELDEEKKKQYLNSIYEKSMRMSELVTMLFEYIKMDSEGFKLNKVRLDLGELLRETIANLYTEFEEKDMHLEIDIIDQPCYYECDRVQLTRVINNILLNAIKYNEPGTKVKVSLDEDKVIRISDNGVPIEKELADNIFEPFTRGDKTRNTKGGSGLGLSISKKIVEMHGGRINLKLKCEPGVIKTFEIVF